MLWIWMFNPDFGVINNMLGYLGIQGPAWLVDKNWAMWAIVIRACWGVGGGMILFLAALQSVPLTYYEAATIDGANAWQRFRRITFPMITPTIFYFVITGVIGSLQEYVLFRVMTNGGPARSTETFVYYLYDKAFVSYTIGYASALSWIIFFVALGMTLLLFKSSGWVFYEGGDERR
jgi:multiple sugar transport system permease protein